ncbi:MAG: AAA domain-containing protein [Candidatus Ornithospirochaeta sp.]|nr:AAA domain-containing protein [Candidatus Ornithospirochaeta sp.]
MERSELLSSIEPFVPDALAYGWFSSAIEADEHSREILREVSTEFSHDRNTVLRIDPKKLSLEYYLEAMDALHKIQPAWSTTLLSLHLASPLLPGTFDLAIVDEAAQCDCVSIIPLMYRAKKIAIIGDPEQFRPILNMTRRKAKLLARDYISHSMFSDMAYDTNSAYSLIRNDGMPFVMLREHFRCNREIIDFCSSNFYRKELVVMTDPEKQKLPSVYTGESIHWVDVPGSLDEQVEAAVNELKRITDSGYDGTIGVICPLKMGVTKLQDKIYRNNLSGSIDVNTAYGFQGGERDTIIFVLANSNDRRKGHRWYTESPENSNIYNVTVSRARSCLVLVGDRNGLRESSNRVLRSLSLYPMDSDEEDSSRFDSPPESILFHALKEAGIMTMPQYPVGPYSLDLAYIDNGKKIDIEVDGYQYHYDRYGHRNARDKRRDAYMEARGWSIIRFPAVDVMKKTSSCVGIARDMIDAKR